MARRTGTGHTGPATERGTEGAEPARPRQAFPTRESRLDPVACGRGAKRCGERRGMGFARSDDRDRTTVSGGAGTQAL